MGSRSRKMVLLCTEKVIVSKTELEGQVRAEEEEIAESSTSKDLYTDQTMTADKTVEDFEVNGTELVPVPSGIIFEKALSEDLLENAEWFLETCDNNLNAVLHPFKASESSSVDEPSKNLEKNIETNANEEIQNENDSNLININSNNLEVNFNENSERDDDSDWIDDGEINSDSSSSLSEIKNSVVATDESLEYYRDEPVGKKRRKRKCPRSWHDARNQKLREQGEAYVGWTRIRGEKAKRGVHREGRKMGPRCTSKLCSKSKIRECNNINEEERNLIFNTFWLTMSWDQRKIYISSLITRTPTKRRNKTPKDEVSRRKVSLFYSLRNRNDKILPVCKNFFLSTFGLKEWTVHHWINPISEDTSFRMHPSSSTLKANYKQSPAGGPAAAKEILCNFLDEMPKLPSHYCRASTNKLYVEPIYGNNISDVYKEYKRICHEKGEGIRPVCRYTFDAIVQQKNISFQPPKKDRCDTCISYEMETIDKVTYDAHINRKNKSRELKTSDTKDGENGKCIVITQDVQAVKMCPSLNASALYFKTKLTCHNFTIYNNITHQARCYWFNETDANLTANTFVSCIVDYLLDTIKDNTKPVIIWSDGCCYQNKNAVMSNALLSFSVSKNVIIYQKYLEKGHTQMEVDSVHATIEKRLGKKHIYLPSDYHKITLEARSVSRYGPYEVKPVSFEFIKDYSKKETLKFESIRPGRKVNDPTVNDIKIIKYTPDGNIQVKLSFDENSPFMDLPQRSNRRPVADINSFKQLQTAPIKIKRQKYEHLQHLKAVIPKDCHGFYDALPHD